MAESAKAGHLERTAHEPRDSALHKVAIRRIDEISDNIRIYRLEMSENGEISFLPGQWLDVFVPSVAKAGGFTITSPPSKAVPTTTSSTSPAYLELAIKKSPDNATAAWLWRPESEILGSELNVRVGGSFVWPPPGIDLSTLRKIVFIAGGMGINPLVSMISHLAEQVDEETAMEVEVLYSFRDPGGEREADGMLFVERMASIFAREKLKGELKLYLTGGTEGGEGPDYVACNEVEVPFQSRRIDADDIAAAVGQDVSAAVVYVCGVPAMTDQFVAYLTSKDGLGMEPGRVLSEKWW